MSLTFEEAKKQTIEKFGKIDEKFEELLDVMNSDCAFCRYYKDCEKCKVQNLCLIYVAIIRILKQLNAMLFFIKCMLEEEKL